MRQWLDGTCPPDLLSTLNCFTCMHLFVPIVYANVHVPVKEPVSVSMCSLLCVSVPLLDMVCFHVCNNGPGHAHSSCVVCVCGVYMMCGMCGLCCGGGGCVVGVWSMITWYVVALPLQLCEPILYSLN